MVGFFGWGGGVGFGVGFGFGFGYANVGWVALAPHELYHPWYGAGYTSFNRTSVVNNANITSTYRNASYTNAVTSVRSADFGRGTVNPSSSVRATAGDLARAGSIRGAMPFMATQSSRRFSDATAATRGMPQTRSNIPFSLAGSRSAGVTRGAPNANFANRGVAPSQQATPRANVNPSTGANGGWRSFDPSAARQPNSSQPRAYSAPPQQSAPQSRSYQAPQQTAPRYSGGAPASVGRGGYATPQRVQINPPIVRERGPSGAYSQPSAGNPAGAARSGGGSRGSGGGGRSGGGHR